MRSSGRRARSCGSGRDRARSPSARDRPMAGDAGHATGADAAEAPRPTERQPRLEPARTEAAMTTRSDPMERLRRLELGARISDLLAGGAGWRTIAAKELADNLLSIRFGVVLLIVALAAVGTVYFSSAYISSVASDASG